MELREIVEKRRAYRSLDPVTVSEDFIEDLAKYAQISPSCFNNQPWRFVFIYDKEKLGAVFEALPGGNVWAKEASLIIAVASTPEYDCQIKGSNYYLFDTGMATAYIILRATELGYVAHPIAGFNEAKVKTILGVPDELTVITLVIVGKHSRTISPVLSEKQIETEKERPERLPLAKFAFKNHFGEGSEEAD